MDYRKTLDYMYEQLPMFQRIGPAAYKADLSNTLALCQLLGNPEKELKTIHIAGTNGKGSVSHLIASALQEARYKTGLYTSPHLKDFRERIKINGQMIAKEKVIQFIETYKDQFEEIGLSFFEMTVGMAFDFFKHENVDIAVIETGMGGRLDSTNVLTPLVSIITNIGYDHTQFLGESLEEIAGEKAGIIKTGIPLIVGETQQGPDKVFTERASVVKTSIIFADQQETINLHTGLKGEWQKKNVQTASIAIQTLRSQGYNINNKEIQKGFLNVITNTGLSGRWQTLNTRPLAICDIGHNLDGISEVLKMIGKTVHDRLHFVLGLVTDKNVDPVLSLLPSSACYYYCKADIPRGMDAKELMKLAGEKGLQGEVYNSVKEAYRSALKNANENDLVFVGGSTFVVAEVL